MGPVPQWNISPKHVSFINYTKNKMANKISEPYMPPIMQRAILLNDLDLRLEKLAVTEGAVYISPIKILCKGDECISRVGDRAEDFIAIDYGHFSRNGSEFFIGQIQEKILIPLGVGNNKHSYITQKQD